MGRKRALVSVTDKDGLVQFVRGLVAMDYEIIATDGTHRYLKDNGVDSRTVEEITGLRSTARVKTLHPAIYKPLLEGGENPIEVLVCNLYPFEKNLEKEIEDLVELIDIGGVCLIRAAAKNYAQVTVVIDPADYDSVLGSLKEETLDINRRKDLAKKAFAYIAYYDSVITSKFGTGMESYGALPLRLDRRLRYGENPHQKAWFFLGEEKNGLIKVYQGKEISYNNFLDAHTAYGAALEHSRKCCVVVKHTSPCGVGVADSALDAYTKAHMGDPVSAFGGVVGFNCEVDEAAASRMTEIFLEVIIAPSFTESALNILKKKKRLRVISSPPEIFSRISIKDAFGGILVQEADKTVNEEFRCVTIKKPNDYERETLDFAWRVCKWVKSNGIVLAIKDRVVGIGAGQPSRVGAVE
ncbi:MAG TPA: bifunctional phosphoribosylaminoimidazolecarboxamide formyltransferase/IMP cyclohydrolase, partial [bacterium (Candidatus Stahlbacteria)]|nr:bifunctional phosphoribosylaminoimidazolecarboxamide formyltransferase/IMP cyclohydrolase [Candidatus Stahlbacteria bacterium]